MTTVFCCRRSWRLGQPFYSRAGRDVWWRLRQADGGGGHSLQVKHLRGLLNVSLPPILWRWTFPSGQTSEGSSQRLSPSNPLEVDIPFRSNIWRVFSTSLSLQSFLTTKQKKKNVKKKTPVCLQSWEPKSNHIFVCQRAGNYALDLVSYKQLIPTEQSDTTFMYFITMTDNHQ